MYQICMYTGLIGLKHIQYIPTIFNLKVSLLCKNDYYSSDLHFQGY